MKSIVIWICVLWLIISCGKMGPYVNSLDGTYVGYYNSNRQDTVQVSFLFEDNKYSGFREKKFCPTLGKGTFEQNENIISFESSSRQADNKLEPTLNGEFSFKVNADGSIRIWKKVGTVVEEFILRKSEDQSLVLGH